MADKQPKRRKTKIETEVFRSCKGVSVVERPQRVDKPKVGFLLAFFHSTLQRAAVPFWHLNVTTVPLKEKSNKNLRHQNIT